MRALFFLLLLLAGWAIIFYPLVASGGGLPLTGAASANPSSSAYPDAWEGTERLQVEPPGAASASSPDVQPVGGTCGDAYTIQGGDTLGEVAKLCGVSLGELLAANTQIQNANQVYPGQVLAIPDPLAGRGGGDPLIFSDAPPQTGGLAPGAVIEVTASGLPPQTGVRIGVGLENSGYHRLAEAQTDAQGSLSVPVTIPWEAVPGESAFVQVTTAGVPSVQRMSETFTIGW